MSYIITLEGNYNPSARAYGYQGRRYQDSRVPSEHMDGLWDAAKGMASSTLKVVTAPVKGITHAVMETGRGVATGDVGRILKAPIKGAGHTIGEQFRGTTEHLEYYWRPSKMSQWMGPAGAGLSAAAPFTGPAAPFLLAGGAALTVAGGVASGVHGTHLQRQADRAVNSPEAQAARAKAEAVKKRNYTYMAVGGAALVGALALMA